MAANTAENGQCEALVGSEGTPNLVTVREASPPPPAEEAAPRPLLKRFEDLPEMVEMLSPLGTEDDGNKTDVENLSDHENMDTAEEKTALSHREEDSGDENKTDVEDLDMGSARHHGVLHEDPSASDAQDTKVTAKRFIEEVQVDSVEHKRVSKQNKFHRSDANHLGQRPSHSRQRSHSQPGSLSSPGAVEACQSPRSASSETEFANLSAHVRAVLGEIEVRSLQFKAASEARKSRGRCATSGMPYRLAGRADQERLLRKFFVEEDVGNLTDEGEFVIMPEPKSPTGRLTAGIEELDVSSGGTDVEELDAEPHRAVNSGREWTETDPDSGEVRHIISKTTHTTVTSVRPTEGGDHWVEAESAMGDSSQPATATRMITTRTTRTVGPDGREQLVTTTTTSCEEGGDEPETRLRRSMQGVLDSFMAEPPPSRPDEE